MIANTGRLWGWWRGFYILYCKIGINSVSGFVINLKYNSVTVSPTCENTLMPPDLFDFYLWNKLRETHKDSVKVSISFSFSLER